MQNELVKIKHRVINRIIVLTTVFLIFPLIIGLLRIESTGWQSLYLFHIACYTIVFFTALLKKRIGLTVKIYIITIIYLAVSILALRYFSLSGGYFFAIMAVAMLAILVDRKITIWFMVLIIAIFLAFAYCFVTGIFEPKISLDIIAKSPSHWISQIMALFLLITIFIFAFGDIYRELINAHTTKNLNERMFRLLFEQSYDGIALFKDNKIFDCNQKACEMFQYSKEELIGKSVTQLSPELQENGLKSDNRSKQLLELAMNGHPQQFEWQHQKADGKLFDVSISLNKINHNNEIFVQTILRDITEKKIKDRELLMHRDHLEELVKFKTKDVNAALEEWKSTSEELVQKRKIIESQNEELNTTLENLKEAQAQLVQTEKMASLGTLTAGVAHEINNPLNYIMGSYVGLEKYFKKHAPLEQNKIELLLNGIKVGLERASGIVTGLNQFSRNNKIFNESCNIHTILDNCLKMLYNPYENRIEIHKKYSNITMLVEGNTSQLHQAFTNILRNALQAIQDKGVITIETKSQDQKYIIEISDSGCGIEAEYISQITDPFYTTKPPGEGTGLGLSITYTIIKDHKGNLEFTSEKDKGTKVKITLPKIHE